MIPDGSISLAATSIGKLSIGTDFDRFRIVSNRVAIVLKMALSIATKRPGSRVARVDSDYCVKIKDCALIISNLPFLESIPQVIVARFLST